jgi:hypothetical protein
LATTVLGGGVATRLIPAVRGIDYFADSALSDNNFALFERGTSSSSSELDKAKMNLSKTERS